MEWLIDASGFSPRSNCGLWTPLLVFLYIVANAIIALAYYAIPTSLYIFYKYRKDLVISPIVTLLFVAFITLCGTTHLCNVLVFYWPAYRLFTFIDILTAIMSVITAIILPVISNQIMKLPTVEQHKEINDLLYAEVESAIEAREAAIASSNLLELKVQQLERLLEHKAWTMATKENLADLRRQLTNVKENHG